jgi:hypothetical protein
MKNHYYIAGLLSFSLLLAGCKKPFNDGVEKYFREDACLVSTDNPTVKTQTYKVNFFLETSGSMSGFMSTKGTTFQKDVWDIVSVLAGNYAEDLRLFQVTAKGEPLKPTLLSDFRNNLNVGTFTAAQSTDIPELLDSVLHQTDKNHVSVFVSDLIFAPSSGNQASLLQITSDIYQRFASKKYASVILQLKSEIYNSKSNLLSSSSPYYVWIVGLEAGVKAVSKQITADLSGNFNEVDFGIHHNVPQYTLLPHIDEADNAIPALCADKGLYYSYSDYDDSNSSKITLNIALNLADLSKNEKENMFLTKNLSMEQADAKLIFKSVSSIPELPNDEDKKLAKKIGATHLFKIEVDQIYNDFALLKLNVKSQRPDWIAKSNLNIDDYKRNETTGLTKMIDGLEKAYGQSSENRLYINPITILITKNQL